MNDCRFVYVTHIGTSAEKLWEALTSGEFTRQYWGGRQIESDWQVGSPVRNLEADGSLDWEGEVLAADPPRKLSYTFQCPGDEWKGETSRVEMTISPSGTGTVKLCVVHDRLSEKMHQDISSGWPAILSNLKTLLERGEPLAYDW